jgi:choline dehydrogenase-like flavoprotein
VARFEADVVIIGGGITAAMVAEKLPELRPNWSVVVVEAGKRLFDFDRRFEYRKRNLDYGEHMWPATTSPTRARAASSRARWRLADRRFTGAACAIAFQKKTRA